MSESGHESSVVSCLPAVAVTVKMSSKARKIVEEARDLGNPELDLADRGVASFEELPGLRESFSLFCSLFTPR